MIFSDWSFEHIQKICTFTEPELIKLLLKIQDTGLIELLPNNRIKLLVANNFSWLDNGPAFNYFKKYVLSDFFKTDFTNENEKLFVLTGMLSEGKRAAFAKRMEELVKEFDLHCKNDRDAGLDNRLGYSVILAMRRWTLDMYQEFVKDKPWI